jgi:hypothetical protein
MKNPCLDTLPTKLTNKQKNTKLFKVISIPFKYYEGFVAFFLTDFINKLKKEGWHVIDTDKDIKSSNIQKDIYDATGIDKIPDVIAVFLLELDKNAFGKNKWSKLKTLDCLKVLIVEDIHDKTDTNALKFMEKFADAIFCRYPYNTKEVIPKSNLKCFNLYHAYTEQFYNNINFSKKKNKVLLSGANDSDFYKLRHSAKELIDNDKTDLIEERKHPGYTIKDAKKEVTNYAKNINQYKLAISDQLTIPKSKNNYPYILAKHFEIPASGTALITNKNIAPYLKPLGFKEDYNYITATPKNLLSKIEHWLKPKNQKKLKQITERGQELVMKNHQNKHRVESFNNTVQKLFFNKYKS